MIIQNLSKDFHIQIITFRSQKLIQSYLFIFFNNNHNSNLLQKLKNSNFSKNFLSPFFRLFWQQKSITNSNLHAAEQGKMAFRATPVKKIC